MPHFSGHELVWSELISLVPTDAALHRSIRLGISFRCIRQLGNLPERRGPLLTYVNVERAAQNRVHGDRETGAGPPTAIAKVVTQRSAGGSYG